ncbi:MAG: zinc ABC transporter ATP-binding protein ZnuC [Alphaproteobacteria bacterium]
MATDRTTPEPLVRVRDVDLRIGRTQILSHVDMTVSRGEIVTLVGPNGAGKSSLVRVVLGLLAPSGGEVWRKPGLRVGYLPQALNIDPVLPINVRRLLALAGPGSADKTKAVLVEVGAADLAERAVQALSGGEFQRVMLARALLRDPDLLVLDEPLRGIDLGGQLALYELIGHLRRNRGIGVLMVSHDLHIVMAATDRVVCLNQHVCCSGAPEAVSRSPEYAALFGAAAARQLAVYAHEHDHSHDLHGHVVKNSKAAAGRS